jgi:hypothetical protein
LDQIAYKDLFRADARMTIEEHGTAFREVSAPVAVAAFTDARYGRISLAPWNTTQSNPQKLRMAIEIIRASA